MSSTESASITEVTRRAIFDELSLSGVRWAGRLAEDDFLSRIYDLQKLPSNDSRYSTAAADIQQHRVSWLDGEDDWVFYDPRFQLLHGSDLVFLRFLAEMVHPVVRVDAADAQTLVDRFNSRLFVDGWALAEASSQSGRKVYAPTRVNARSPVFEEPTGWMKVDRQLQEAKLRLASATNEEQFQVVGLLCREVLISASQEAFAPIKHWTNLAPQPSPTDAYRKLEAFFDVELSGGSNEEARAHAKSALRLALALQHHRSAQYKMAALCLEGTVSVVNIVAILGGRRV